VLKADDRKPVLLLRSFIDDERLNWQKTEGSFVDSSLESRLTSHFAHIWSLHCGRRTVRGRAGHRRSANNFIPNTFLSESDLSEVISVHSESWALAPQRVAELSGAPARPSTIMVAIRDPLQKLGAPSGIIWN